MTIMKWMKKEASHNFIIFYYLNYKFFFPDDDWGSFSLSQSESVNALTKITQFSI